MISKFKVSILSLLVKAYLHRALTLKAMCIEWIYKRCRDLIEGPDFEDMPQPLLHELFLYYADRQGSSTRIRGPDDPVEIRRQKEYAEYLGQ